ncbi:MAG: exodeoxyribonuclease III [Candidatus Kapaibacteriota bacterium]
MKIISWNINGYRSITGQNPRKTSYGKSNENILFEYIKSENPDIICLQETKSEPSQIKPELQAPPGYYSFYNWSKAKKGYSGVVTFSKIPAKKVIDNIGVEKFDIEGRVIQTEFDDFTLLNIYFPNGGAENNRVDFKLEFYDAIFDYTNKLIAENHKIIMCGDYNTAHKEIDLARPKENEKTTGFLPEEREKLDWLVEHNWLDTFRVFNQEPNNYTWWDQKTRARERNVGWRIDYHFITGNLKNNLKDAFIQPEVFGSDHCPVGIILDV